MDIPRLTSPPLIRVHDLNSGFERRYSNSRASLRTSPPSVPSRPSMPIPNARADPPPPPLPPPRVIEGLAQGHDVGWNFANSDSKGVFQKSTLAPIKQGSSLHGGGYMQPRLNTKGRSEDLAEGFEMDESDRKSSTVSTTQALSQPDIQMGSVGAAEDDAQQPTSPSSIANQRLQGEKPLAQQSFQHSSEAYDKHLLSKIGKSNSPPRRFSGDVTASGLSCPSQAKDGRNLQRLSVTDVSAPSFDPISRWVTSPASGGVSPGSKPSWRDYMDYRSPSVDSSAPSSAVDSDYYARRRDGGRGSASGPRHYNDDNSSLPNRSNRGSYDQHAFLTEPETDFSMEETGGFRKLNLDDRTPPHNVFRQPFSKQQGLKRRALSPPAEGSRDDKAPTSTTNQASDLPQRSGTGHSYPRSPNPRFHPNRGSVSSTSSVGPRNGSYASSLGLSAAGSSMTSISSIDRPSPGGTSPSSDLDPSQDSAYVHPTSLNAPSLTSHTVASRSPRSQNPPESRSATVARAMSAQSAVNDSRAGNAPRIGGAYMCECCPKKPKKFESEEELRVHMMEKQYKCAFCQNRFKNKNEAERHQNSLHLRRQSWSCAAISGYEAAFHPSTSPTSQTSNGPSGDACGYCGEEFSNFPSRDWEARFEHLTNVHKFGECNQAKKFFRADHFRQHLKHSHAGTSGKWTNMLENACMKYEATADSPTSTVMEAGEPSQPTAQMTTTPSTTAEDSQRRS